MDPDRLTPRVPAVPGAPGALSRDVGGRPAGTGRTSRLGSLPEPWTAAGPDTAESPDAVMERLVDAVVDRLEQRVVDELERRGRRQGWGGF